MKKLYYTLTALEPLIITHHSNDPNMYETLQFVRGTLIQGVFAKLYLNMPHKIADDEFKRLIIKGDVMFSNAYPKKFKEVFLPAPSGIVKGKYNSEKAYNLFNIKEGFDIQTKGLHSLVSFNQAGISALKIRKEIRLHNEIDAQTRSTKEGILFNYQSLPEGIVFEGSITVRNDNDLPVVTSVLSDDKILRLGRSATAEYGKVKFAWSSDPGEKKDEIKGNVIMTLLSDAIILNENGFSDHNYKSVNPFLSGAVVLKSISRKDRVEGFLNIWKLRKPSENVFAAGSSFLLNQMPSNAYDLLNYGLGERTHEGYGQISFSLVKYNDADYNLSDWAPAELTKPDIMPPLTAKVLFEARFNRLKESVLIKALNDAEKTSPRISSNHLIGKLKAMAKYPETFNQNIKELRNPAQKHLKKCYLGNNNLFDHISRVLTGHYKLYQSNFEADFSSHENDFIKLYFEQYFNQLRRLNK